MSDSVVMIITGLLALGVPVWTLWGIWRNVRRTPTRQGALANVLGSIAGTVVLGVVLPAALLGMLDPFPVWLVFAMPTTGAATVLGWRWQALRPGNWSNPGFLACSLVLLAALAMAAVAVT